MADTATRPEANHERLDGRFDRFDAALARMCGRLAVVLDAVGGDDATTEFLRSLSDLVSVADAGGRDTVAGDACLDLPTLGAFEPVDRLVSALALDPVEIDLLVLATVAHHHEGVAAVLRDLHPEGRPWPTVGLAQTMGELGLLGGGRAISRHDLRAKLHGDSLLQMGVIEIDATGAHAERSVRTAPALFESLVGLDGWSPGVVVDRRPTPPWGLSAWFDDKAVAAATAAVVSSAPVVVLASTDRPDALVGRLAALVEVAGRVPAVLHAGQLDTRVARVVALLAVVRGVVPVVWSENAVVEPLEVAGLPVPILVATTSAEVTAWPRPVLVVPTTPLNRDDRIDAIEHAVPEIGRVANPIGPATIEPADVAVAAADLRALSQLARTAISRSDLAAAVDSKTMSSVPTGGLLLHPLAGWDDLVLPDARMMQLVEAVARAREQHLVFDEWGFLPGRPGRTGLRLLFCGPPGTGKTLAAEVIAGELGRDLLVIDLSQLVSKWIGETEKNLAAAFDAAERGGAVIFFDEADSLFSKRTEVGDARDRYANLETAYLLSRLERFDGVAILATNLRQNLDAAFARRIEFIVPFDVPDRDQREQLWRHHLPGTAPLASSVDLARLATLYEVSGALIRNAAVAAAFLAASERSAGVAGGSSAGDIGVRHIVHALRREYVKSGQAFPGAPSGMSG